MTPDNSTMREPIDTEIVKQAVALLRAGQRVNLNDLIIEAHGGPEKLAAYLLDEFDPDAIDNDPEDEEDDFTDAAVWFADGSDSDEGAVR